MQNQYIFCINNVTLILFVVVVSVGCLLLPNTPTPQNNCSVKAQVNLKVMLRDDDCTDRESLLSKEFVHYPDDNNHNSDECFNCYSPVIAGRRKRILMCLSLDPFYWAIYRLLSEGVMLCSYGFASTLRNNNVGLALLGSYLFFCCVMAPLWQHFVIIPVDPASSSSSNNSDREREAGEGGGGGVGCEHGCMVGMGCFHLVGLCACRNLLVVRQDLAPPPHHHPDATGGGAGGGDGWWSDSLASDRLDTFSYSRTNTVSSVNTNNTSTFAAGPSVSRYVPFSLYNLLYIITHGGHQELNPSLPYNHMPSFGMGRSMLLCYGTATRASLNLALVYNAYYALLITDEHDLFFTTVSLVALGSALADLDVYLVAVFFGTLLYPYTLVVWFATYLPMFDWLLNPRQGTFLFWMLKKYWKTVVACVNSDTRNKKSSSRRGGADKTMAGGRSGEEEYEEEYEHYEDVQ